MDRSDILVGVLGRRVEGQQGVIQVLRGERRERRQGEGQCVESLEQGVERGDGILSTALSLESVSVESNVPVGEFGNEVEESGHHGVESVGCERQGGRDTILVGVDGGSTNDIAPPRLTLHLLLDVLDQRLTPCQDPPVHDVLRLGSVRVVHKLFSVSSLVKLGLTDEESQTVDPSSDDGVSDVSYTVVLEDQVVTSYNGRVDKVESVRECVSNDRQHASPNLACSSVLKPTSKHRIRKDAESPRDQGNFANSCSSSFRRFQVPIPTRSSSSMAPYQRDEFRARSTCRTNHESGRYPRRRNRRGKHVGIAPLTC